jgi:hypothetical protein
MWHSGMTLTNQNCIHEAIKNRLISGNAFYNADHNLLFSCLLSKNAWLKMETVFFTET